MTENAPDQLLQVHRRLDAQDSRINAGEARLGASEARLGAHDGRLSILETQQAVSDERAAHIRKSLDKIESGMTWLIRLVIGGILAGVIAFMIRGGFHVG